MAFPFRSDDRITVSALVGPTSIRHQLSRDDLQWFRDLVGMEGVELINRPKVQKAKKKAKQDEKEATTEEA